MAKKKNKINYFQLEPSAFLADAEFNAMNAKHRGIYCSLNFYLYTNNGRLRYCPEFLAGLSNCDLKDFELFWNLYAHKFVPKGNFIKHKRVSKEIRNARRRLQVARSKGLKGAEKRWHSHQSAMANENETKAKKSKDITNTKDPALISASFRFRKNLEKHILPQTKSDKTSLTNLERWLLEKIENKELRVEIYSRVVQFAKQSRKGNKPIALFFDTVKRELGYRKDLNG